MASPPASLCTALALAPAFVVFLCMACQGKGLLDWLVMRVRIITGPTCASAPLALEDTATSCSLRSLACRVRSCGPLMDRIRWTSISSERRMLRFFPDALYQWTSLVRGHLAHLYLLPHTLVQLSLWGTSCDCPHKLSLHVGLTRLNFISPSGTNLDTVFI